VIEMTANKASAEQAADVSPDVAAALATLEAAGIDTPEKFSELLSPPTPPPAEPAHVEYAKDVVYQRLQELLADAGVPEIAAEAGSWASDLVTRLVDHGLTIPEEWAERSPSAVLQPSFPGKAARE
jgi:hypothetical protein